MSKLKLIVLEYVELFVFLALWLAHVVWFGWTRYYFFPETYLIHAGNIIKDQEISREDRSKAHAYWWNRHYCDAGVKAAMLNDPDAMVMLVKRVHPWFLASELLYVKSPNYKARWWNQNEKIYSIKQ